MICRASSRIVRLMLKNTRTNEEDQRTGARTFASKVYQEREMVYT